VARKAADSIAAFLKDSGRTPSRKELKEFAIALVDSQPNMGSMWNLANSILLSDLSSQEIRRICSEAVRHHSSAPGRIGALAAALIGGRVVVTNSSSAAVLDALARVPRKAKTKVLIPESRPMREGVALAKRLAEMGVDVTLFSDALLARAVSRAEVAIAGVDAVTPCGVVGKVGLMHLALCAKEYSVECYACADSSKFAPLSYQPDNRPQDELLANIPRGVKVENVYFEEVPQRLFTAIITETGCLKPRQASACFSEMRIAPELRDR